MITIKLTDVVMNSVRQRIMQCILTNKTATVNELAATLPDIPKPSIYRHVKILCDNKIIKVTNEKKIRGTTEKTYALDENGNAGKDEDTSTVIENYLLKLMLTFKHYFNSDNQNPEKDMLCVGGVTLMLDDTQMTEFMKSYSKLITQAMQTPPNENSKPRSITIISAPDIKE